jgi:hypothetical protein
MNAVLLLAVLVQVEVVEQPNAHVLVRCRVRDAEVHADGTPVGKVNKRLPVFVGEQPLQMAVVRRGCWDVLFDLPLKKGKSLTVNVPNLRPGISLVGHEMNLVNDFRLMNRSGRGSREGYKVTHTTSHVEVVGAPFHGTMFQYLTGKTKKADYYVLRFEYQIDKGTTLTTADMFGAHRFPLIIDGKPHTFIVVVGKESGWALLDYKTIVPKIVMSPVNLSYIAIPYKPGAKGRFVLRRFFFKVIDEKTFDALSKAYGRD